MATGTRVRTLDEPNRRTANDALDLDRMNDEVPSVARGSRRRRSQRKVRRPDGFKTAGGVRAGEPPADHAKIWARGTFPAEAGASSWVRLPS
jgi:hypothetical protein